METIDHRSYSFSWARRMIVVFGEKKQIIAPDLFPSESEHLHRWPPSDRVQTMLSAALYRFQRTSRGPGRNFEREKNTFDHLQEEGQPSRLLLMVFGNRVSVPRGQLRHHVHQSHVQEDARRRREEPRGDLGQGGADQQAEDHAHHGQEGGEYVVEDGLLDRHPGLDQHGEVADLVRQLVTENRHTCG